MKTMMISRTWVIAAAVAIAWTPAELAAKDRATQQPGLAALEAPAAASASQEDWEWKGRIAQGKSVEVKGVNGDVHAERARGNEVEVTARRRGKRSDPASVQIVVLEHNDGVTICAVYPSEDRNRPNECQPGGRGRMNVKDNDVQVEFIVRVPAGVGFSGRTVNGDVDAHSIDGDVDAHTVNGGVDVSATGLVQATTVNGSITVSMGRADWKGTLDFTTVNGSVTLEFPDELNCDVSVSTVNGHISSDFPLTVDGRFSPRHIKGTIGKGGRSLVIKTVNGSVQLRRS